MIVYYILMGLDHMSSENKTIGIMTSGGDAPGMNAAIRSVVRSALARGMRIMGIKRGYSGLINDEIEEMNLRSVSEILHRGGTVLYTARSTEFRTLEGQQKAAENCRKHNMSGVVVIGGDGSFRGALDLSRQGINCVGIPATIDNDIAASDYTIGFDTAINTACEMIDRLRDTSQSHERCSVVEVMGRKAGHLALEVGAASGATSIIIPEIPIDIENDIIAKINNVQKKGKKHFIIVVAEGTGLTNELAERIRTETGIETRVTVLGHVQRGGAPTVRERVFASAMGYRAVELLDHNITNRVVITRNNEISDMDINEALLLRKPIDLKLYTISNTISI